MNEMNVHVPLWNYVLDEAKDLNNPDDLVNTANAYYRAKGSKTLFFMNILDQRIKENAAVYSVSCYVISCYFDSIDGN